MAYLSASVASDDVSSASWAVLDAQFQNPRESEAQGRDQLAGVDVTFTATGTIATIAFALVGKGDGTVYKYFEGKAAAGTRRSSEDGSSGNYLGYIDFSSTSAPSAHSNDAVSKVDLMHGVPADYDTEQDLEWRFGCVAAPSSGSVIVSVSTTPVM